MKKILLLLLLSSPCLAGGPKYGYNDPKLDDEINNIYHDIASVTKGDVRISSSSLSTSTITNLYVGTAMISNLRGITDGSNACSGCVGEYIESVVSAVNSPTTGQYGDLTSISLAAGDWDVTVVAYLSRNGATYTLDGAFQIGISTVSGNTNAGTAVGDNILYFVNQTGSLSQNDSSSSVANYRMNLTTTKTVYAKYRAEYTAGGPPQWSARLSARRVR